MWRAPIAVGLACLLGVLLLAGLPEAGSVLGSGGRVPWGLWSLWYASGPLFDTGLYTNLVLHPHGGWVWPAAGVEGVLWAPVTRALGAAMAWNALAALRLFAGGVGAALLLRRLGCDPWWGLLVGLSPAVLQGVDAGWLEAGAMAWLPWALLCLLSDRGPWVGLLAGLAMATSPATAVATLLALAVLEPRRLLRPAAVLALVLAAVPMGLEAWTLQPTRALRDDAAMALAGLDYKKVWLAGQGSLAAAVGLGPGVAWGGPLLLLSLVAWLQPRARPGLALVALGAFLALGPTLVLEADHPARLGGRQVPLPLLLFSWLPPVRGAEDLVRLGVLSWLGAAVALGRASAGQRWPVALVPAVLLSGGPGWSVLPEVVEVPEGPVLYFPPTPVPWTLYAQTVHGQPISTGISTAGPRDYELLVSQPRWTPRQLQQWALEKGYLTAVIDPSTPRGEVLAGLVGGTVVPLQGEPWPDVLVQGHVYQDEPQVPPLPTGIVPPPEGDWSWLDPALSGLLQVTPDARTRLWSLTSDDGRTWTRQGVVAQAFTSLGLATVGDEALVLTGLLDLPPSLQLPGQHPASVVALTTPDLQTWGLRRYWLDRPLVVVDPQLDFPGGRPLLTAWSTDRLGVDPALVPGEHQVLRASLGGSGRLLAGPSPHGAAGLADPMFAGGVLFYTRLAQGAVPSVVAWKDAVLSELPGLSVPFAWTDEQGWHLVAQRGTAVVASDSPDAVTWSPPVELALDLASCESPVVASFQEQRVMFCSERLGFR